MASFKARVTEWMDTAAVDAWRTHGAGLLSDTNIMLHADGPQPLNGRPLSDPVWDGLILYTARKSKTTDTQTHPRWVHNREELWTRLVDAYPNRPKLMLLLSSQVYGPFGAHGPVYVR